MQLYVTDVTASTVRPMKQLRGFERVAIPAGQTHTVIFSLDEEAFALYDKDMKKVVEPGDFIIAVGASSRDIRQTAKLTL